MDDPNQSPLFVSMANRVVNNFLGGWGKAFSADALEPWTLGTIWDDKVLHRAFEVFGGVPALELVDANDAVPDPILTGLARETRLPV
jgi:hypothetical protein